MVSAIVHVSHANMTRLVLQNVTIVQRQSHFLFGCISSIALASHFSVDM